MTAASDFPGRLRESIERHTERIVAGQKIARAIIDARSQAKAEKESVMTAKVQGLPFALKRVVTTLNEAAEKAVDRLEKASQQQFESIKQVHAVADVIEESTKQTNDLIEQMGKSNSPPSGGEASDQK